MSRPGIDTDPGEAVRALMFLTLHRYRRGEPWRAWKSFDRGAMGRLDEKDPISDALGKAKSVALSEKGWRGCEEAHCRLFARQAGPTATRN
jgi:hypothetical protein